MWRVAQELTYLLVPYPLAFDVPAGLPGLLVYHHVTPNNKAMCTCLAAPIASARSIVIVHWYLLNTLYMLTHHRLRASHNVRVRIFTPYTNLGPDGVVFKIKVLQCTRNIHAYRTYGLT